MPALAGSPIQRAFADSFKQVCDKRVWRAFLNFDLAINLLISKLESGECFKGIEYNERQGYCGICNAPRFELFKDFFFLSMVASK